MVLQVRDQQLNVLLWQRGAAPFEGAGPCPAARWGRRAPGDLPGPAPGHQGRPHRHRVPGAAGDPQRSAAGPAGPRAGHGLPGPGLRRRATRACPPDTAWHPVQDLPPTAFDHGSIAESGRDRLRAKLSYTNIGFALAPETFTIAQLRDIYAASARPSGLGDQPAAGADPPRRDRGHRRGRPAHARWAAGRPRSTGSRPGPWSSPIPSPRSARRPCPPQPPRDDARTAAP